MFVLIAEVAFLWIKSKKVRQEELIFGVFFVVKESPELVLKIIKNQKSP